MKEELEKLIAIPLDEYKELLIIKGKYEELSKKPEVLHIKPAELGGYKNIDPFPPQPEYKITCNNCEEELYTGKHTSEYGPSKYCDELLS